ncbi:MAG: hypothetical protein A2Y82_03740 [Candidatus Buchananbacteria bacterium RBG_13_36_9]|uniref:Uncharacterized protein n=1 Tax=Candidatus Buchananbacteria bacterium RBG_13_36_9 TaxID=1797530 RepID=A0A1G1XLD1_9BACT|nr:MAG: hypothetical protein A2Y82_03740 [Candidatus Buchananbacteria bacterium RBG_13_36_9]
MIFHILYTDEFHKSDWHLIVDAQNENKAQEKVRYYLRSKHAQQTTIRFLRQGKFSKEYASSSFFKIFFQNGTGEKHCQILAKNQEDAKTILEDRIPFRDIIRIEQKKITIGTVEKKEHHELKFQGIIARPLAAVA